MPFARTLTGSAVTWFGATSPSSICGRSNYRDGYRIGLSPDSSPVLTRRRRRPKGRTETRPWNLASCLYLSFLADDDSDCLFFTMLVSFQCLTFFPLLKVYCHPRCYKPAHFLSLAAVVFCPLQLILWHMDPLAGLSAWWFGPGHHVVVVPFLPLSFGSTQKI